MTALSFIHLRLHSEYSVQDSILTIDRAIAMASEDGMPALALTDLANLFGLVKFYSGARKKGVKPIVGCDIWLAGRDQPDKLSRMLLLVQNRAGYRRLCELLTMAYRGNLHRGRAVIKQEWFETLGTDGLIALSGAQWGEVGLALLNDSWDSARAMAEEWSRLFPDRYYLEIQRNGRPESESHLAQAVALASELGLPVVATHPVQFQTPEDFKAHEARVCIAEGYMLADRRRPQSFNQGDYFKSQAEMAELFADLPEALENSVEIARRCNLTLELGKSKLPLFPTPAGMSLDDYLRQRANEGLDARLADLFPDPS
ncbi:MAG: PHP domain-containing protein, partial [Hydrogenophilaceae bacterium]